LNDEIGDGAVAIGRQAQIGQAVLGVERFTSPQNPERGTVQQQRLVYGESMRSRRLCLNDPLELRSGSSLCFNEWRQEQQDACCDR
jgi:hypothetical protein